MRFGRLALACSFVVVEMITTGCSSSVGPPPDGGNPDGTTYDLALDLPVGCPPSDANNLGVGAACTRGGNECKRAGMPSGLVCACDTVDGVTLSGVPCICTYAELNPSPSDSSACHAAQPNCGSDATCCDYLNEAYYCSPNVCLPGGVCIDFSAM
jgi:hypothetical protein